MDPLKNVSRKMKLIRIQKGISQTEAAEKVGCSSAMYSRWENKGGISLASFFKIAKALEVSTEDLNPENDLMLTV